MIPWSKVGLLFPTGGIGSWVDRPGIIIPDVILEFLPMTGQTREVMIHRGVTRPDPAGYDAIAGYPGLVPQTQNYRTNLLSRTE